jgi:hypothetical protein
MVIVMAFVSVKPYPCCGLALEVFFFMRLAILAGGGAPPEAIIRRVDVS